MLLLRMERKLHLTHRKPINTYKRGYSVITIMFEDKEILKKVLREGVSSLSNKGDLPMRESIAYLFDKKYSDHDAEVISRLIREENESKETT